jgi:hypothetical protein
MNRAFSAGGFHFDAVSAAMPQADINRAFGPVKRGMPSEGPSRGRFD